jgi:ubiquinone/menaquinone biosynthesis C-methylase UbiE
MADSQQADQAIKFYESRAANYDGSWHSDFTSRFITHLDIQPGQKVLDLACGTGLLSFLEADAVGPSGRVVGVDVTPSMLAIAAFKKSRTGDTYSNVSFVEGDILHLENMDVLTEGTFDIITVASTLVLFPDPKAAIEHWAKYLKPGGLIAMDATHPRNLVAGMVLERVARRLDLPIPYNRAWSKSESTLKHVLESAGLQVEKVVTIDNQSGYGKRSYDMEQWDDFFVENVIVKDVTRTFANNDIRRKAQGVFKEEWGKLAIDGKVEEVDSVFLAVARRRRYLTRDLRRPANCGMLSCRRLEVHCTDSGGRSSVRRRMSMRQRAVHVRRDSKRHNRLLLPRMPTGVWLRLSPVRPGAIGHFPCHKSLDAPNVEAIECSRENVLLELRHAC